METKILALIVPFHNSRNKCSRLLETLSQVTGTDIEIILVDDGSSDDTWILLSEFRTKSLIDCTLIRQENGGPGAARNTGLKATQALYVWFVDSDDDINPDAIALLREHHKSDFDFIDFNIATKKGLRSSINFPAGAYEADSWSRKDLLSNFGRICSKIIKRYLISENNLFYPEKCLYEDNPLCFSYPFHIRKFMKSDISGYIHHEDHDSITRQKNINPKFFDRLMTASLGIRSGIKLSKDPSDIEIINRKFTEIFLTNSLATIKNRSHLLPGALTSARVAKLYRQEANSLGISSSIFYIMEISSKHRLYLAFVYACSFLLSDQASYFKTLHKKAWQK